MDLKNLHDRLASDNEYRRSYAEEDLLHRVAERVRLIRNERGLSQKELAEELCTKQPAIARIEGGFENLTLRTLSNIAFELSCRPEDLVSRDIPLLLTEGWSRGDTDGEEDDLNGKEASWSRTTVLDSSSGDQVALEKGNDLVAAGV